MPKVFDMGRDDLTNFLQKLDNDFNRYAYLYTLLEGNLILQNTYNKLSKKFGKSLSDYENQALDILNSDPKVSALTAEFEEAEKRVRKLRRLTRIYRPELVERLNNKTTWIVAAVACIFAMVVANVVGVIITAFVGYVFYMGLHANKFVSDLEKAEQQYSDLYNQLHNVLVAKENELWQKDFKEFCSIPENQKLIDHAAEATKQQLDEFNKLDFSKYSYLPSMYQDNQSVHNTLHYLLTGQATNWQDCAQLLSQHEFQERQFNEAQAQRENQERIINNQQQMIKNQKEALSNQQRIIENQQTQTDIMNAMNQNIQNVNKEISAMRKDMIRHATIQEAEMADMLRKQSEQMFQQRRFQREQLDEMRRSVNSTPYTQVAVAPVG